MLVLLCQVVVVPCIISVPNNQETGKSETLVNRRVIILEFVNAKNSADYKYLEESIPDSFADPLSRTKSFELLDGSFWRKLLDAKIYSKEDAWRETSAIEAGKLAGADVVIIGKFVAFVDHMEIFCKAIELSSSRVMVSRNKSAPLDNNMFDAVKKLTEEISIEMKEKLPPLPQRIITQERIKYVTIEKKESPDQVSNFNWNNKKISISLNPGLFANLQPKPGAKSLCGICEIQAELTARFWVVPGLYLGAKFDFGEIWSSSTTLGDSPLIDGFAMIGYGLPAKRWLFTLDIGAGYFLIFSKSNGLQYNPSFMARLGAEVLLAPAFSIGLSTSAHMFYDIPKSMYFGGLALTLNYLM